MDFRDYKIISAHLVDQPKYCICVYVSEHHLFKQGQDWEALAGSLARRFVEEFRRKCNLGKAAARKEAGIK